MPFAVKDWQDYPALSTPILASELEDLERRLSNYTDLAIAAAAGAGKQTIVVNAAEQTFTTGNTPQAATPPDRVDLTLAEAHVVRVQVQYNAWKPTGTDLMGQLFLDGAQATNEVGTPIQYSMGAGNPTVVQLLGGYTSTQGAQLAQPATLLTAPVVAMGTGAFFYLAAGAHSVEMRYYSVNSGGNSRISQRRVVVTT